MERASGLASSNRCNNGPAKVNAEKRHSMDEVRQRELQDTVGVGVRHGVALARQVRLGTGKPRWCAGGPGRATTGTHGDADKDGDRAGCG